MKGGVVFTPLPLTLLFWEVSFLSDSWRVDNCQGSQVQLSHKQETKRKNGQDNATMQQQACTFSRNMKQFSPHL